MAEVGWVVMTKRLLIYVAVGVLLAQLIAIPLLIAGITEGWSHFFLCFILGFVVFGVAKRLSDE